eukprot:435377-Prorocentrum_minimum.AAC.1
MRLTSTQALVALSTCDCHRRKRCWYCQHATDIDLSARSRCNQVCGQGNTQAGYPLAEHRVLRRLVWSDTDSRGPGAHAVLGGAGRRQQADGRAGTGPGGAP